MVYIRNEFCDQIRYFPGLSQKQSHPILGGRGESTATVFDELRSSQQFLLMTPTRPQKAVPASIAKTRNLIPLVKCFSNFFKSRFLLWLHRRRHELRLSLSLYWYGTTLVTAILLASKTQLMSRFTISSISQGPLMVAKATLRRSSFYKKAVLSED
jgi:hypothetical protein